MFSKRLKNRAEFWMAPSTFAIGHLSNRQIPHLQALTYLPLAGRLPSAISCLRSNCSRDSFLEENLQLSTVSPLPTPGHYLPSAGDDSAPFNLNSTVARGERPACKRFWSRLSMTIFGGKPKKLLPIANCWQINKNGTYKAENWTSACANFLPRNDIMPPLQKKQVIFPRQQGR